MKSAHIRNIYVPLLVIIAAFTAVACALSDFRFSDPDQYYHFTLSRNWATSLSLHTFPQIVGIGWNEYFSDKEFLFHIMTTAGHILGGDLGVVFVSRLCAVFILIFIYLITWRLTATVSLSLFAALAPLVSETSVLHLMLVRAYNLSAVLVLAMIFFLIARKRNALILTAFVFPWAYHAVQIPAAIIGVWAATQWISKQPMRLGLFGLMGLIAGMIIHPYFPSNLVMLWTVAAIPFHQLTSDALPFGPEQVPFRSDNLLLVFRYQFVFLTLILSTYAIRLLEPLPTEKKDARKNAEYLFLSALSIIFFGLLMLSPRVQDYFIPFSAIAGSLALTYFKNPQRTMAICASIIAAICVFTWPYRNIEYTFKNFKSFDDSYFAVVKAIPSPGPVFNCDWWGGHYPIYLNDLPVLDVLDPTILKTYDETLFNVVTALRSGQSIDPYFTIYQLLGYKYVLCSSASKLESQIARDPRFTLLSSSKNFQEDVFMYKIESTDAIFSIESFEVKNSDGQWVEPPQLPNVPNPTMISQNSAHSCMELRPKENSNSKLTSGAYFVFSGTGDLTVFKNDSVYLDETHLPDTHMWGEVLLPISGNGQWRIRICPRKAMDPIAIGVAILTEAQKRLWCNEKPKKMSQAFTLATDLCKHIEATQNTKN